ncbi:MAG: T9SS type A sorting domain-containing protein [Muribaculaceae bacterium]|nr:T9SS type A sorting domain-containing protein [Muribaculaceae bacterium]
MRRFLVYIIAALMPMLANAEQWRLHPTFDGSLSRIVDTENYTYLLSRAQPYFAGLGDYAVNYFTLFRYDKKGDEMQTLNAQNLLSDNILQTIEYNREKKYLVAVYDNGNIDLIYDNGDVVNIPGLKLAGSDFSKTVNRITFSPEHNEIYLATGFGYLVIDDKDGEVKRTVNLGTPLTAVSRFEGKLVAGSADGLFFTDFKNYPKWEDFGQLSGFTDVKSLMPWKNRLYVWAGEGGATQVPYLTLDNGSLVTNPLIQGPVVSVEPRKDGFQISGAEGLWCFDKDNNITQYIRKPEDTWKNIVGWSGNVFWKDNGRDGVSAVRATQSGSHISNWNTLIEKIVPNASNAFKATYMAYSPKYGMLVRNAGIDGRWSKYDARVPDLISGYRNMEWTPLSTTYRYNTDAFLQSNPGGVAIDPRNGDHVYSGSVFHGLLRLDLADPSKSLRLARKGDGANGMPGFVPVHDDFTSWTDVSVFSAPTFDNNGNLWTAWFDRDKAVKNQDNLEFWYWTPADRLASNDAASFRPFGRIPVKGPMGGPLQTLMALTSSANKNCLLYFSGTYQNPLVVYDTNGTLDNTADDRFVSTATFADRDGSGNVVAEYLRCAYEDPNTGDVWIGHGEGVFRLSPKAFIQNGGGVNRIKVARNDGTGQADYLLSGVSINCITADPSGRKWFATLGGGIVITSSDGTEVIKSYTTDNSPLPDNTIYGLCYNPENNSMMISTEKGLAEVFLSNATSDSSGSDIMIYPNPVRPDYFGYVNIEGLQDNALVKVVDAGGNLIKEIGFASGGEAKWDITNLNARRVPGGVYYILATGGPDSDSFSAAGKVLVVN